MLHLKDSKEINKSISSLLPSLLKSLSDPADEVVLINLQILALISSEKKQFLKVLNALILLFYEDRVLLETRGALVIRKLCVLLDSRSIFLSLAEILSTFTHFEFISHMVQTMNLILLTAPELITLRKSLKNCFHNYRKKSIFSTNVSQKSIVTNLGKSTSDFSNDKNSNDISMIQNDNYNEINESNNININNNINYKSIANDNNKLYDHNDSDFFISLFSSWSHNPVATFSLCLLAEAYDLSSKLILKFSEVDVTVGFLLQIDKLVQLLESPVFIHLRLQLLEVSTRHHGDLLKSLYGLLMVCTYLYYFIFLLSLMVHCRSFLCYCLAFFVSFLLPFYLIFFPVHPSICTFFCFSFFSLISYFPYIFPLLLCFSIICILPLNLNKLLEYTHSKLLL